MAPVSHDFDGRHFWFLPPLVGFPFLPSLKHPPWIKVGADQRPSPCATTRFYKLNIFQNDTLIPYKSVYLIGVFHFERIYGRYSLKSLKMQSASFLKPINESASFLKPINESVSSNGRNSKNPSMLSQCLNRSARKFCCSKLEWCRIVQ
jgi:hypothetical protein